MIMTSSTSPFVLSFLWFLFAATTFNYGICNGDPKFLCKEEEEQVLLLFKKSVTDRSNRLSSWSAQKDCCTWNGVHCYNKTGRVIKLDLHNPYYLDDGSYSSREMIRLKGKIDLSLLKLKFLNYLDLSGNDFDGIRNSFEDSHISGSVNLTGPQHNNNMSNLHYLDLAGNNNLHVENLRWVSRFSSLKHLKLDAINLHQETHWLQYMTMIPSLSELHMCACQLDNTSPSFVHANFTSLRFLALSNNNFSSELPNWLFNLSNLNHLDLSENRFTGLLPEWLGELKYLEYVDLSNNSFSGPIPETLGNLSSLKILDLHINKLNGTLPESLWQLPELMVLSVAQNSLTGVVSEVNFCRLSTLKILDMSANSFIIDVNSHWIPPFQLQVISFSSCKLGPKFPAWLQTQKSLYYLDISKSGIADAAPNWFWKFVASVKHIKLSENSIRGDLSNVLLNSSCTDLSSNHFRGRLPHISSHITALNVANNSFSGPISHSICSMMHTEYNLELMDLSNNNFSGELPDCWMHWQSLLHLNLGSNILSGKIPNSMGSLSRLQSLHLGNNCFSGDIPRSLQNCKDLKLIDLRVNQFSGNIPNWMGEWTKALQLRSNKFSGNIPPQICQLSSLIVLDLANNSLSGSIPKCLNNISAMVATDNWHNSDSDSLDYNYDYEFYLENLMLNTKGRESEYKKNLKYVRMVDLSSNNLSGSIPTEIFLLARLQSLNLSQNHLTGKISQDIGAMKSLESLDLSRNHLFGDIPQSMSNLSFLNHLDLSYNNFSGKIPLGTQLQSFDAVSYIGNPQLCGDPLPKNCTVEEESLNRTRIRKNEDDSENSSFYMGMGVGFAVGFWVICGVLFFNRTWRHAYFRFLDDINDWVYVTTVLKVNRFLQNLRSCHFSN